MDAGTRRKGISDRSDRFSGGHSTGIAESVLRPFRNGVYQHRRFPMSGRLSGSGKPLHLYGSSPSSDDGPISANHRGKVLSLHRRSECPDRSWGGGISSTGLVVRSRRYSGSSPSVRSSDDGLPLSCGGQRALDRSARKGSAIAPA